eukprot:3450686-Prymnesium_polylepis.1
MSPPHTGLTSLVRACGCGATRKQHDAANKQDAVLSLTPVDVPLLDAPKTAPQVASSGSSPAAQPVSSEDMKHAASASEAAQQDVASDASKSARRNDAH